MEQASQKLVVADFKEYISNILPKAERRDLDKIPHIEVRNSALDEGETILYISYSHYAKTLEALTIAENNAIALEKILKEGLPFEDFKDGMYVKVLPRTKKKPFFS